MAAKDWKTFSPVYVGSRAWGVKAADEAAAIALLTKWGRTHNSKCVVCEDSPTMSEYSVTDGCRMNGDAYGRMIYSCSKCQWEVSYVWDDY